MFTIFSSLEKTDDSQVNWQDFSRSLFRTGAEMTDSKKFEDMIDHRSYTQLKHL